MMTTVNIFSLPMRRPNDANAKTIGEYFRTILVELWRQGEGFSGKRPLGNGGWEIDVYTALVDAGLITGTFNPDGYLEDCDEDTAYGLVQSALREAMISGVSKMSIDVTQVAVDTLQVIKVGNEITWNAGDFYLLFDEQTPHLLTDITTGFRGDGLAVESKARLWVSGKYRTLEIKEQVSDLLVGKIISCEEVFDDQRSDWNSLMRERQVT